MIGQPTIGRIHAADERAAAAAPRGRVSRGRLVVHGHFYQPSRVDPFSGTVPPDPTAAPAHDWTARISAECYRPERRARQPRADVVGPRADAGGLACSTAIRSRIAGSSTAIRGVNGMAQPFHHTILPLASAADRRTEIRWGLRDFAWRFGPAGDAGCGCRRARSTCRRSGCSPSTASGTRSSRRGRPATRVETRRPYRVELGGGLEHRRRAL